MCRHGCRPVHGHVCRHVCVAMCECVCIDVRVCTRAHIDMCTVDMCAHMFAHMCTDICVDILVHMDVDLCIGIRKACKCPYTHALICAHMCADGRTLNPADTKLVGSPVPGRILAKWQLLPPLYTENTVLFSILACWIALVAHASHRHQSQPDLIPAGLLA